MKKTSKRLIALALAAIMLFAMVGFTAAPEAEDEGLYYTVLGDSNASAYGLDAYFDNAGSPEAVKDGDLIPGSYPAIIADSIGATTVDCRSHSGWRTTEFLRVLGSIDSWDQWSDNFLNALGWIRMDIPAEKAKLQKAITSADFITLDFGSNDIYSAAISMVGTKYSNILDDLQMDLSIPQNLNELYAQLMVAAEKAGILLEVVKSFKDTIASNMEAFKANSVKTVEAIRALNPDAKIIMLGVFCPVSFDIKLGDKFTLDIITSSDIHVAQLNKWLRSQSPARSEYTYVDRAKTECFGLPALDFSKLIPFDDNVKYSAVKMVHPTEKGHKYIAKQIMNALKNETVAPVVSMQYSKILRTATLRWSCVEDAKYYRVYTSSSENGDYKYIGTTPIGYFVSLAKPGQYFKVAAVMDFNTVSAMSTAICYK